MSIDSQADFYLDFRRFSDLKLDARENSGQAAQTVAQQFEGLLVQQMLAAMRSAARVDGAQQSSYLEFYREMYDKQLAQSIAGQDRLGVARLIMRQLPDGENEAAAAPSSRRVNMPESGAATHGTQALDDAIATGPAPQRTPPVPEASSAAPVAAGNQTAAGAAGVVLGRVVDNDFAEVASIEAQNRRWQRPEQFIADLLPEARRAADNLGVSPELLIAQAALETGWGRHTMKFDDGRSSNNLFGIKAGSDWQGGALNKASLEFSGGALTSRVSRFRAYPTPAHSLADYVDLIQSAPRYRSALAQAGDDHAYIRAIQHAGYATDPDYADKVIGILNGELLQQTLASLNPGVTDHA